VNLGDELRVVMYVELECENWWSMLVMMVFARVKLYDEGEESQEGHEHCVLYT